MAPFVVSIVGRDGNPVDVCQSTSLRNALYVRDRLRVAERAQTTDRPMSFVTDADDPERGMLDDEDLESMPLTAAWSNIGRRDRDTYTSTVEGAAAAARRHER